MSVIHKIQPSFSSGELSPNLYSRVDLNRYSTGLKTCRNFIIHPHGGTSNRAGTYFVAEAKDSSKKTMIKKFVFSDTQAYTIEFGEGYARFYKDHSVILKSSADAWLTSTPYVVGDFVTNATVIYYCIEDHTSGTFATDLAAGKWVAQTIYEIPLPYTEDDLFDLRFERSADVLYIFHKNYKTVTVSRYDDDDWRVGEWFQDDGPFMPENTDDTITMAVSAVSGTAAVDIVTVGDVFQTSGHVGSLWKLTHFIPSQAVSTSFTATGSSTTISCFTTWRVISHGTWTGKFRVEKSLDAGSTWTNIREFSGSNDFNVDTYGTEDIETNPDPFLIRVTCTSFTSGTMNVDLSSDSFYQHGVLQLLTVTSSTHATATILASPGSTAAVSTWSEGAWSDYRGYPSCGTFHQDRLCTAASDDEPMNIWGTQTGNYESQRVNSTVLDTDAFNIKLLSRSLNSVNGLVSIGDLIALTSASEWRIGADKTTLTPSTIYAKAQGYRGSSGIHPVVVGNQIIYCQSNGKVIRNFGYDYSVDSYVGVDLRILSEHLFNGYSIVEMDYQQDNDSLVWLVRSDGVLLSLTYMQEQEVVAWSWHDTDGLFESITVIPADGYDELWMVVKRGNKRFIEYMPQRMESTDVRDQHFVDCGIVFDDPITDVSSITAAEPPVVTTDSAHGLSNGDYVDIDGVVGMTDLNGNRYKVANVTTYTFELTDEESGDDIDGTGFDAYESGAEIRKCYDTFSGLDHLEGLSVVALANGNVMPAQVVSGGEISFSRKYSRVHAGLAYVSDFETLNVEIGLKDGTTQGRPVKISEVTFRLLNSRGGWIGHDFDSLYESFTPTRLSLGSAPELFSGDMVESLGAGYEFGGRIAYRQIDPLPVTITAVIPKIMVH